MLVVGEGLVVLSFCVRDERREQALPYDLGVYCERMRCRQWIWWELAPTLSVISMLGVFLLVVGEGLVVLSFCVRDERREQAPALHYLQAYPLE